MAYRSSVPSLKATPLNGVKGTVVPQALSQTEDVYRTPEVLGNIREQVRSFVRMLPPYPP